MATTYTISAVNAKVGSIVLTPSDASMMPSYFLNIKNAKLVGDNPVLLGTSTLNPQATISLFCFDRNYWLIDNMPMSSITTIGGVSTPATLALTLAAIAALIAQ